MIITIASLRPVMIEAPRGAEVKKRNLTFKKDSLFEFLTIALSPFLKYSTYLADRCFIVILLIEKNSNCTRFVTRVHTCYGYTFCITALTNR